MEQADVKEIIRVREDGTQDKVEHGAVIEINGDDIHMAFVDVKPVDIVRLAIGLVEATRQMGLSEALDMMVNHYYGEEPEGVDADAGLQADTGSQE